MREMSWTRALDVAARCFVGTWAVLSILWLAYAVIKRPDVRAAEGVRLAAEIAQEDRESCARLGRAAEIDAAAFGRCVMELDGVRQRQDERSRWAQAF